MSVVAIHRGCSVRTEDVSMAYVSRDSETAQDGNARLVLVLVFRSGAVQRIPYGNLEAVMQAYDALNQEDRVHAFFSGFKTPFQSLGTVARRCYDAVRRR